MAGTRLRAAAAAAILVAAAAYKYHLTHGQAADVLATQSAFTLTEGPMFASGEGPFNTRGESLISVAFTATATAPATTASTDALNVWAIFVDTYTRGAVGIVVDDAVSRTTHYCCTPALWNDEACGPNVEVGGLILHPAFVSTERTLPAPFKFPLALGGAGTPTGTITGNATGIVHTAGSQYLIMAVCDAKGTALGMPSIAMEMDAEFKNPYGYLPGQVYGYLPFYGTLFVVYLLFAVVYGGMMLRKRQYLLLLQYAILGVVLFGVLETALYFFTYNAKNETGIPTPCRVCGSPTADYMTAVVVSVFKRAVSRCLLLAVALGFGVVHPSLSRRATITTVALGVAYLAASLIYDVSRETAYDSAAPTIWELPVLVLDMVFLMGIYGGLGKLRRELQAAGQMAKLLLYKRLYVVLVANIVAWFIVVCVQVLTRFGALPLHWSAYFLLYSFWDMLYLAILIAVAAIWSPGEESFQYAWYSQSATSEAEAGMDVESGAIGGSHASSGGNGGGIEMAGLHAGSLAGTDDSGAARQGRGGAGSQATAQQPSRGPIDDGEDLDGDDIDLERFERVERQAPQAAFSIGADDDEDGAGGDAGGHGARSTTAAAPRPAAATTSSGAAGGGGLAAQHDQAAIDDAVVVLDVASGADAPAAPAASSGDDGATSGAGASVPSSPVPGSRVPRLAPPKGDAGAPPGASL